MSPGSYPLPPPSSEVSDGCLQCLLCIDLEIRRDAFHFPGPASARIVRAADGEQHLEAGRKQWKLSFALDLPPDLKTGRWREWGRRRRI